MIHPRLAPSIVCVALLTGSTPAAQERTAPRVFIGGAPIPDDVQPRVTVEQQRGALDQARIKVTGPLGIAYAGAVAQGADVEIVALGLDRAAISIFEGEVVALEPGLEQAQPFVVIRASSPLPRGETPSPWPVTITPRPGGAAALVAFLPRLSAASSIQEVVVTGVDAATGGPITGHAVAPTISVARGSNAPFGQSVAIETDRRFSSTAEADAFALSVLTGLLATRISAEALTDGSPEIGIGTFVELKGLDTEFEGAYYVAGVSHRFGPDSYGGYSSAFRLRRADLGMFHIPAIDDEVLVAFEHGDLSSPYIVGSWWDCDSRRSPERSDDDSCRLLRWPW